MIQWRGGKGSGEGTSWRSKKISAEAVKSEVPPQEKRATSPETTASELMRKHLQTQIDRIDLQIKTARDSGASHLVETLMSQRAEWQQRLDEKK